MVISNRDDNMISYDVNDNGVLTIWHGNAILATLEGCGGLDSEGLENLVDEVLYEMGIVE